MYVPLLSGHYCLLTQNTGCYEPGTFDLRSPQPRATVLCQWIKSMSQQKPFHHQILNQPGWWNRPEGQFYPQKPATNYNRVENSNIQSQPVLITGATGTLGQAFAQLCNLRGIPYYLTSRHELDITDLAMVELFTLDLNPWAVINTAGYVRVDEAEHNTDTCYKANITGPKNLAQICQKLTIPFVTFSSDLVFDGLKHQPYVESDLPNPLNQYGYSKMMAENQVFEQMPNALVIRTGGFFGPWDTYNWVTSSLHALKRGQAVSLPFDCISSITYVPDLVQTTLDLLLDQETGIWHLTNNSPGLSWYKLIKDAARLCQINTQQLIPCASEAMPWVAKRPTYCLLSSEKASIMPNITNALSRYAEAFMLQSSARMALNY
jgi:dTDP-4-dehydrorhamnose reductase